MIYYDGKKKQTTEYIAIDEAAWMQRMIHDRRPLAEILEDCLREGIIIPKPEMVH